MDKDVEERFGRIEDTLERVGKRLDALAVRQDKFEAELEVQDHKWNQRFEQLWKAHSVLMDTQNRVWDSIQQLTANIDKLAKGGGPNGHGN
jgi:chromosome segregation ATPase